MINIRNRKNRKITPPPTVTTPPLIVTPEIINPGTTICPNIVTLNNSPFYTAKYGESIYVDTNLIGNNCFVILPEENIYGGLIYIKNLSNPSSYSVSVGSYILTNEDWVLLRKGKFNAWELLASKIKVNNGLSVNNGSIELGGILESDTDIEINSNILSISKEGNSLIEFNAEEYDFNTGDYIPVLNLNDVDGNNSIDWNNRVLKNQNGDTILNWSDSFIIKNLPTDTIGLPPGTLYISNQQTGDVKVVLIPRGNLTGAATINRGQTATLTVVLTGTPPWSIDYSDGITSTTINNIMETPYEFQLSPISTKTFTLVAMSDYFESGIPSGSARITVNP